MVGHAGESNNKPRVISAGDTFFAKFVISSAFLCGAVVLVWLTVRAVVAIHEVASPLRIVGNLACIGLSISVVWPLARLKRVALSKASLHVSNYLREIVVPLNNVNNIREIEGTRSRIVIEFNRQTHFGRQISFSPIGLSPPRPHPIVAELRAAVASSGERQSLASAPGNQLP